MATEDEKEAFVKEVGCHCNHLSLRHVDDATIDLVLCACNPPIVAHSTLLAFTLAQVLHCHNCEDPSVKIVVCCQSCDSGEFGDPLLPMILCADCNLGFHVSDGRDT